MNLVIILTKARIQEKEYSNCNKKYTKVNCQVSFSPLAPVSSQQRTGTTDQLQFQQAGFIKQAACKALSRCESRLNPIGVVSTHLTSLFYFLSLPFGHSWGLTGYYPCKLGPLPITNQGRECKQCACSRPIREGGVFGCVFPSEAHSELRFFTGFLSLSLLWVFSSCHFLQVPLQTPFSTLSSEVNIS